MPPHVAAYRAGRLALRLLAEKHAKRVARSRTTYGASVPGARLNRRLSSLADLPDACLDRLHPVVALNAGHFFDLLGAGWVRVHPGMTCEGIEGVSFESAVSDPNLIHTSVNKANRVRSAQIFSLIGDADYRPIDWSIDFRSGYRWPADAYFRDLPIGRTRGADIKMPWELGRLQHLPRMALLATARSSGGVASQLHRTARNQILDFIAANPPQYGANWGCPMDVGIRAANLCLAVDIFEQAGLAFDAAFHEVLCASLADHGRHIASNLEWAPEGRSNHYLSDLAGLAFIGAYLPESDETLTWLAFALSEIANETMTQFHADGGNYEGSVGYHRLSAEIVAYTVALALGLPEETIGRLHALVPHTAAIGRVPVEKDIGQRAAALAAAPEPALQDRLRAIARFLEAAAAPDGDLVQIGDMDSGRMFKLDVVLDRHRDSAGRPIENELSTLSTATALATLLSEKLTIRADGDAAGNVVRALSRGRVLDRPATGGATAVRSQAQTIDRGPPLSQRTYRFALPDNATADSALEEFPHFGLWVWRTPRMHLTLRCAPHARGDAPYGHTHDDNLVLTLWVDGEWVIEDPGTYVYTSFPELRNAYRAAAAHFVPRAREWQAVVFDPAYLFDCRHLATARMLRADASGAEAELVRGDAAIRRTIAWEEAGCLVVVDRSWGCHLDPHVPAPAAPPAGRGYGRRAPHARQYPAATNIIP